MSATNGGGAALFARSGWWNDAEHDFASLRSVSRFRLQLLQHWLGGDAAGLTVVDLGCGGGLLAVPLARLGARVFGVDRALPALQDACRQECAGFTAVAADLAAVPLRDGIADLVLLADVVEHLRTPAAAIASAARLLRPGGHLFVQTINRTFAARLLAIWLGEGLGLIPRGTHDHHLFVRPDELRRMAEACGLVPQHVLGESPRLWTSLRERRVVLRQSSSQRVAYAMWLKKEAA